MLIRPARPDDFDAVGGMLAGTYLAEGYADPEYAVSLGDTGPRAAQTTVLVAEVDGVVAGSVTVVTKGGDYANLADPGEAEIRMLVTDPARRGQGVGNALMDAALEQVREDGVEVVRLSTQTQMTVAQRMYERLGFVRTPERDWGIRGRSFLTYALTLSWCGHCGARGVQHDEPLEPPRYCTRCRRRMVVQVHPTGWTAKCAVHGTLASS